MSKRLGGMVLLLQLVSVAALGWPLFAGAAPGPVEFQTVAEARGTVALLPRQEGFEIRGSNVRVEDALVSIAEQGNLAIRLFCEDPVSRERVPSIVATAGTLADLTAQVLGTRYTVELTSAGGEPVSFGRDAAVVNAYPEGCRDRAEPVRVLRPLAGHPALAQPPDQITLADLERLLRTEGYVVRRQVMKALVGRDPAGGFDLALGALADPHPEVVFEAARTLAALSRGTGRAGVAAAAIAESLEQVPLLEVVPVLARLDRDRAWSAVEALTLSEGKKRHGFAIRALLLTRDPRGLPFLARMVREGETDLALQAALAIGTTGGQDAVATLRDLLRSAADERQAMAASAIQLLPEDIGRPAREDVERRVLDPAVPDAILSALLSSNFTGPLERLLGEPGVDPGLKVRALRVIGRSGSDRNAELAARGLDAPQADVRAEAAKALASLNATEAMPFLVRAASDPDTEVRLQAVIGLETQYAAPQTVAALEKALNDSDERLPRAAVDALRRYGEPDEVATRALIAATRHKDPYVAEQARKLVERWGRGPGAPPTPNSP